jgi:hypothetical protein
LACQDKFFVNNPLDVKGSDECALDCALHLCRLFLSLQVRTFSLGGPPLCLEVIPLFRAVVTGDNPGQESHLRSEGESLWNQRRCKAQHKYILRGFQSASERYRLIDRHRSANFRDST